jgi:hypothetical protein
LRILNRIEKNVADYVKTQNSIVNTEKMMILSRWECGMTYRRR